VISSRSSGFGVVDRQGLEQKLCSINWEGVEELTKTHNNVHKVLEGQAEQEGRRGRECCAQSPSLMTDVSKIRAHATSSPQLEESIINTYENLCTFQKAARGVQQLQTEALGKFVGRSKSI
jgi:hypothetical protein